VQSFCGGCVEFKATLTMVELVTEVHHLYILNANIAMQTKLGGLIYQYEYTP
jgi:hypothetical protein